MRCSGCGLEIDDGDGYAAFTYGRGETALEKLQSYKVARYCNDCARSLRAHLGLAEPSQIPQPPVSCHDERVNF